jgi:hypothetical protein
MAFQNMDADTGMEEATPPPEENNNRPFLIAVAVLGGIFLLLLLCIAAYVVLFQPRIRAQNQAREATALAQNAGTASAATLTVEARSFTATFTAPRPTDTPPRATNTLVVAAALATETPQPTTPAVSSGTLQALQTTVAAGKSLTPGVTGTITRAGWADEAGAPTLIMIAAVLIVVIFLARRLRTAGS